MQADARYSYAVTASDNADRTYSRAVLAVFRFASGREVSFLRNTICATSCDTLPMTPRRRAWFCGSHSVLCSWGHVGTPSPNLSRRRVPTSLLRSRSRLRIFRASARVNRSTSSVSASKRLAARSAAMDLFRRSNNLASSGSVISSGERHRSKSSGDGERGNGTSRGSSIKRRG